MKFISFLVGILFSVAAQASAEQEITAFKYEDNPLKEYAPPTSSVYHIARSDEDLPDIQHYMSNPKADEPYPIFIFASGSSSRENLVSVIHAHRYFLEEILNIGCALVTLEQVGVSYDAIDADLFFQYYTRTQRYNDHLDIINHFKNNPPENWDGRFVLLGVSEGGHIAMRLAEELGDEIIATILWSAAGDHTWEDEVWDFLQEIDVPKDLEITLPQTRDALHEVFEACIANPTADEEYLVMTNKYMADAIQYPLPNYEKLAGKRIFAVTGVNDSLITSSDAFVENAREAGAEITYHRIKDMDHCIRLRPDIYNKTFEWLQDKIHISLASLL